MSKRELAFALWMLLCIALTMWTRQLSWGLGGGVVALAVRALLARRQWTPSGSFGLANGVTTIRLALVASLPWWFGALSRPGFVALVLGLLALDAFDGWLARRHNTASAFGAVFDMETDALGVLALSLLLWRHELVGAWVLVAGLWRYVYAAAVALVPTLREAPRSSLYRVLFLLLMLCLAGAFLPVRHLPSVLAAIGTALVSFSFLHSLVRSIAATSSRAASDQVRDGDRSA